MVVGIVWITCYHVMGQITDNALLFKWLLFVSRARSGGTDNNGRKGVGGGSSASVGERYRLLGSHRALLSG